MKMPLGYIYSRYPVLSQTFCDAEMLELERRGHEIVLASLYPPKTELRHEYLAKLRAKIQYAPESRALDKLARKAKRSGRWPAALVQEHDLKYGPEYKAALRARNAFFFVELFERERVPHFHVHFANRAAHTALFVKAISGTSFSITVHGQDFMTDLGNEELLRELCLAAEFVGAETDYSRDLLASTIDKRGASDVFPTVIAEAMASGRPVVSTTVAGIPELVANGETGLLVPPDDSKALANALERLVRDGNLRASFGRAARQRIEDVFTIERTIEPLLAHFAATARSVLIRR